MSTDANDSGDAPRTLLAASTGGHLEQLVRLSRRLVPSCQGVVWVTSDEPQSRSLLDGQEVFHLRYVPPRRADLVLANTRATLRLLNQERFARVVTTGAAMPLSVLFAARARGIPCHWIESSARANGPSLSGRIVSRVPGMHLYTQYPAWADSRWRYRGSVLDAYEPRPSQLPAGGLARRAVVTFGTQKTYGFRRAVVALLRVLPEILAPDATVLWQTGSTDVTGLPIQAEPMLSAERLRAAVADADLVVAHAGVGSALTALDQGKAPVLLPRLKEYGEMIDDHQLMIAAELEARGLAVNRSPDQLTSADLERAMASGVGSAADLPPFELVE